MRSIHHDGPPACRKSNFGLEDRTDFYKFHTNEPTTRSNHELKWEIPVYITDAGFARWLAQSWIHLLGFGFWPFWFALYFGSNLLVVLAGIYDLVTRRRLHPAYIIGVAWIFANQMLALSLYFSPAWLGCAKRIIAAWPW